MNNLLLILYTTSATLCMTLIFLVLKARPSGVKKAFLSQLVTVFIWLTGTILVLLSQDEKNIRIFSIYTYLGAIFISVANFHFVVEVLYLNKFKKIVFLGYLIGILIFIPILLSGNLIEGYRIYDWGFWFRHSKFHFTYLLYFIIFSILAMFLLYKGMKNAPNLHERKKRKLLFYSYLVTYLASYDFLPTYGIDILPLGFIFINIFLIVSFYMIWHFNIVGVYRDFFGIHIIKPLPIKVLLYNFMGYPGDLYHLIPSRYLASFLASLKNEFPHEVEFWDRGNLEYSEKLSLKGLRKRFLIKLGHEIFSDIKINKTPSYLKIIPFKFFIDRANNCLKRNSINIIYEDLDNILKHKVEVVFMNFFQGPGLEESLKLAELLKIESPSIKIFAVGHRISWFGKEAIKLSNHIDAYVLGTHSNDALVNLAKGTPFSQIKNIVYRDKLGKEVYTGNSENETINDHPIPEYHETYYKGIKSKISMFEISFSNEACPFNCNFCVRPVNYGTTVVKRDPEKIVDEIEFLNQEFDTKIFRFSDSSIPPKMLTAVANIMIKRGLHRSITYSNFMRCSEKSIEDFVTIRKSGCRAMFLGVESGSERILKNIFDKKITTTAIENTIKEIHSAKIFVVVSLIYPAPTEDEISSKETFELLKRLRPYIGSVLIQPAGVYPNTKWHKNPSDFGIHIPHDYLESGVSYPIEPLKPLRLWKPFPFSYRIFDKNEKEVTFQDIVNAFTSFESKIRTELNLPNIQDYGYILAKSFKKDPATYSIDAVKFMITQDSNNLAKHVRV